MNIYISHKYKELMTNKEQSYKYAIWANRNAIFLSPVNFRDFRSSQSPVFRANEPNYACDLGKFVKLTPLCVCEYVIVKHFGASHACTRITHNTRVPAVAVTIRLYARTIGQSRGS